MIRETVTKFAAVVIMLAALTSGATAQPAPAEGPLPSVAETEARLDLLSQLNPQAYEAAIAATETYGVDTETGTDFSRVPESVVSTLDPVIWAALIDHADAIDRYVAGNDPVIIDTAQVIDATERAIPIGPVLRAIYNFIRANWRAIKEAAEASGKWAWYKAHRCAEGAAIALYNHGGDFTTDDPFQITILVGVAINGCIQHL